MNQLKIECRLSFQVKHWSIDGLFGQDISSLQNYFSFHEQQGEYAREIKMRKGIRGGYRAVLRKYYPQWKVKTRTSPYSSSKFSPQFLFQSKRALHHFAKLCINLPHPFACFLHYSGWWGRFEEINSIFCVSFIYFLLPFLFHQGLTVW